MDTLDAIRERGAARRALPPPAQRRVIREAAGVSLNELAAALGVQPITLSRWERGIAAPGYRFKDRRLLERYVEALEALRK